MTKRQQKSDKTKAKIYECSMKLFTEMRYDQVKIVDICERSGVSVGTFYYYYKSKEDIVEQGFAKYNEALESVLDSYEPTHDPLENIRYYLSSLIDTLRQFDRELSVIFSHRLLLSLIGDFHPDDNYITLDGISFLKTQVEAAQRLGIFRTDIPVDSIVEAFRRQTRSAAYDWCLYHHERDLKQIRMFDFELLLDALTVKK